MKSTESSVADTMTVTGYEVLDLEATNALYRSPILRASRFYINPHLGLSALQGQIGFRTVQSFG